MKLPSTYKRHRITIEAVLTVGIVISFCLAALISTFMIMEQNSALKGSKKLEIKAISSFNHSFNSFENTIFSFLMEDNLAKRTKKIEHVTHSHKHMVKKYADFRAVLDNHMAHDPEHASLKMLVENLDSQMMFLSTATQSIAVSDPVRNKEDLLSSRQIVQMLILDIESALANAREHSYGFNKNLKNNFWIFLTVVIMGIAGLGLIVLLLMKIRKLEGAFHEKKKIMQLLEPRIAALEESHDGIGITDADGTITYVNPALAFYHGYSSAQDVIGKPWTALYAQEQQEWFEIEVFPVLNSDAYWQGQCRGLKKNGDETPQDIAITLMPGGGWVWVVRDHSELMETLTLSNRRLAAIEAAGDGIGLVDPDGNLSYINRAFMDIHGIPYNRMHDYLRQSWAKLYSEKGQRDIETKVMPALHEFGRWNGEAPMLRRDGEIILVEMSMALLPDGGMIGTVRDISDRQKAAAEKADLQNQVFQAQKMEAIGQLAGGIAHDFNNILSSIIGYTEFLLEDLPTASKPHNFAAQIMKGSMQARHLIDQILAFSRRRTSAREILNVGDVLEETVTMLHSTLPPDVKMDVSINCEQPLISADLSNISQIMINLCLNARDALEDDKGIIRIETDLCKGAHIDMPVTVDNNIPPSNYMLEVQIVAEDKTARMTLGMISKTHDYIAVKVQDNGTGMSAAVMERIFEPFFTTKDIDKGTGLGLSTVMGMMAPHQGAVSVKSTLGKGTCFTLYFPAAKIMAHDVKTSKTLPKTEEDTHSRKERILVVEDQDDVRDVMVLTLNRMGYHANTSPSGDEALNHLKNNADAYDLILSDYLMPGVTGIDIALYIEKNITSLPVIIVTGHGDEEMEAICSGIGCIKALLHKPVSRTVLMEAIHTALDN